MGAVVVFLAVGKGKNPLNLKELPKRLGADITADASGYTFDHAFGAHSRYKIHASKLVQYKQGKALLQDVKIELYDEDGSRVDRIEGNEFEYDQNNKMATAAGPVEITLMRPGVAPAIAPRATPGQVAGGKPKGSTLASAAETAARGEIHVKTSGLTFDEKSGLAKTDQHVDFSMVQGSGSSMGASYDSQQGYLVLIRAVELNTQRAGDTVRIHAQHAQFERDDRICRLHAATADYRGGEATAGDAKVLFREDGSAVRLDAMNGFTLVTATGGHIAAPAGSMDFNEHNQPRHGHLEGGVKMDSTRQSVNGDRQRQMHGTAPTAELDFTPQGELRHTHLERGVEMQSEELSQAANGPLRVSRTWNSPVADVVFRDNGHGQAEPATIHGVQGAVVTGKSRRGTAASEPSRLAADEVTGEFGPNSVLTAMNGVGHASIEDTNGAGTRQTSTGDRLEAHFAQGGEASGKGEPGGAGQIQSAVLDGHVVLTQEPVARPGTQAGASLRAWAGRAVYEGTGEWLHLSMSPRAEDGGLQMTAEKIDVSRQSGDAFAHGNVKATWLDTGTARAGAQGKPAGGSEGQGSMALGGKGPAHVIAAEAQLHQATGEATFRGRARLWQEANSVSGPVIVLDRQKQTLVARSTDPTEPVKAVLLSAGGPEPGAAAAKQGGSDSGNGSAGKPATPSVIRVRGGDLKYSDAERKAVMRGGALGTVVAETATATSVSDQVELVLLPVGNHAGKDGGQAQVDTMTARGHVVVTSAGRRGTGEQLVYTGESGDYVLTGTVAIPPRMTDAARGNVTGEALIFHGRDDSVSIEGGGQGTTTETRTPK